MGIVEKENNWRHFTPAEFGQCTDGTVDLPKFNIKKAY